MYGIVSLIWELLSIIFHRTALEFVEFWIRMYIVHTPRIDSGPAKWLFLYDFVQKLWGLFSLGISKSLLNLDPEVLLESNQIKSLMIKNNS